jgi:hypothetical protein
MNERIAQLAEEATYKMEFGGDVLQTSNGEVTYEIPAGFIKSFAKLLVQECATIVEGFEITQEVALDEYVDYEASVVLKEHFGVEE